MITRKLMLLSLGVLILPLAACTTLKNGTPTASEDGSDTSLAKTHWRLVSYGPRGSEAPVIEGSNLSLQFEEGDRAGGSAGCNTFGAQYQVSGDNQLSVTDIVSTLMACSDEDLMDQEAKYLDALGSAESYDLTGKNLTIRFAGGVLNFSRVSSRVPNKVNV